MESQHDERGGKIGAWIYVKCLLENAGGAVYIDEARQIISACEHKYRQEPKCCSSS